jgi:hypothetical protein
VHPSHYEGGESETPDSHDLERDQTTLPLIRAAIARGLPVLAICRGIQELNVALGGSLIQRVHARPGFRDHRGGPGPHETRYGPKHPITVTGNLTVWRWRPARPTARSRRWRCRPLPAGCWACNGIRSGRSPATRTVLLFSLLSAKPASPGRGSVRGVARKLNPK